MKHKLIAIIVVSGLLLITAGAAFAKGPITVTISGPGLKGAVVVSDPDVKGWLLTFQLEDLGAQVSESQVPQNLGEGYEITRTYLDENGAAVAVDRSMYYADPEGGRGYLFYKGMDAPGESSEANKWFRATDGGDMTVREVLGHNGVILGAAAPADVVKAQPAPVQAAPISAPQVEPAAPQAVPAAVTGTADPANAMPTSGLMILMSAVILFALIGGAALVARQRSTARAES
jgi:hypothetical protein